MQNRFNFLFCLMFVCISSVSSAADWPQFRGPNSDGTTTEKISAKWRPLWKVPLNSGYSSFAVAHGKASTLVTQQTGGVDYEVCLTFDAKTGKVLWAKSLGVANYIEKRPHHDANSGAPDNDGGDGPRSTPSIDEDRIFVLTGNLVLFALD